MFRDVVLIVVGCLVLIGGIFYLSNFWNEHVCYQKADAMRVESRWSLSTGCFIRVGGKWVPLRNYREFGDG